jgi:hypothetical protein
MNNGKFFVRLPAENPAGLEMFCARAEETHRNYAGDSVPIRGLLNFYGRASVIEVVVGREEIVDLSGSAVG